MCAAEFSTLRVLDSESGTPCLHRFLLWWDTGPDVELHVDPIGTEELPRLGVPGSRGCTGLGNARTSHQPLQLNLYSSYGPSVLSQTAMR